MKTAAAVIFGKAIAYISKKARIGGGSAAPGLYALKIDPNLVSKLASKIPRNIVITGTNGKTTTSRMLAHFAKEAGLKVIRNHTGSNLERGIASTLVANHRLFTVNHKPDLGIWELDEAAFNTVAPKLKPDAVVFLNVFRDQLDRYGEIDTVVKNWSRTLTTLPAKTTILVNGDDNNTAKLKDTFKGKVKIFGIENYKIRGESLEKNRPQKLDFEAKNVRLNGLKGSRFEITINHKLYTINLSLPGIYHIYDATAAIAAASHLGLPVNQIAGSLTHFQPAFGRVERLPFGHIFLIKNPAGATQVFETIAPQVKKADRLLLALNDKLADGTDVSWIWDAEFEKLQAAGNRFQVLCSGTRADDLAVRLKYAGFDPGQISVDSDLKKALRKARTGLKGRLFILPTYTAMLELQSILVKAGTKKPYWED